MGVLETAVQNLLDLCLNTTANEEVEALQSQVSRISALGNVLTSGHTPTTTYSQTTMTRTGSSGAYTITRVVDPSWTTILSTATWASYYYSEKSAGTITLLEVEIGLLTLDQNPLPQRIIIRQRPHQQSLLPPWLQVLHRRRMGMKPLSR